jgi:hypothetical protein
VEKIYPAWAGFFHSVELLPRIFPQCGKNDPKLFHCLEKSLKRCRCARYGSLARPATPVAIELAFAQRPSGSGSALAYFPLCGKKSALRPIFFHGVENYFPHRGKMVGRAPGGLTTEK